jgi:hypothetical protein
MNMSTRIGVLEAYDDEQLVVATPDLAVLGAELQRLGVTLRELESDPVLGLTLCEVRIGDAAHSTLQGDSELKECLIARKWSGKPPSGGVSDLDLLSAWLRKKFRDKYGEWVPKFGKNRMISPVRGLPYVGGGGVGDPFSAGYGDPRQPEPGTGPVGAPGNHDPVSQFLTEPRPDEPGKGVRVGVIDTDLYPHEWLAGAYDAPPHNLLAAQAPGPRPASAGHGTFVAGLILQRAPGAQLVVRPVLDSKAVGKTWDVARTMASFSSLSTPILNLSLGCYTDDSRPPLVLARAVSVLSPAILLVAAAGNHGDIETLRQQQGHNLPPWTNSLTSLTPVWPGAFDQVTAVGAADRSGSRAVFSPDLPWVDVTAPGVGLLSTYLYGDIRLAQPTSGNRTVKFDGYARWDGTSFAAAYVSGMVAANITPERDARRALAKILASPGSPVTRFTQ